MSDPVLGGELKPRGERTGAVVRLGETEAADNLALGEPREVALLEFLTAERICSPRARSACRDLLSRASAGTH